MCTELLVWQVEEETDLGQGSLRSYHALHMGKGVRRSAT